MSFDNISPAIVIVCYILCEIAKKTFVKSDNAKKMLPVICACLGIAAGVIIYIINPELLGSSNILDAITAGGLSGLAATGCNQIYKKVGKFKGEIQDDENSSDM